MHYLKISALTAYLSSISKNQQKVMILKEIKVLERAVTSILVTDVGDGFW